MALFKPVIRVLFPALALFIFSFSLMHLKPGDPVLALTGQSSDAATRQQLRHEYGLDRPFVESLFYRASRYARLELGQSLSGQPVARVILNALPATIALAVLAIVVSFSLSLFFVIGGLYHQGLLRTGRRLASFFLSLPVFVVGLLLLYLFYFWLEWLPPGGYPDGAFVYLLLPAFSLGFKSFGRVYFFVETKMTEVLRRPVFRALRARGYSLAAQLWPYALRSVIPPLSGLLLVELGGLLAGAIVIEQIFFFPGLGNAWFEALVTDDRVLLQGLTFFSGMLFLVLFQAGRSLQGDKR